MFNFNAVFQKRPKTLDMTPEELDTITVMTGAELSEEQALKMLDEGAEVDFVLTRHNIYLTKHPLHLFDALHIKEEDCLIPNGVLRYEKPLKTLNFGYFLNGDEMTETRRISQKKITDFLERRGMKIEKIGSLNSRESSNEANQKIAGDWLDAFNEKNIDKLLDLYAPDAVHHSPRLLQKQPETKGKIQGREAMKEWWGAAFTDMPQLRYLLMGVETRGNEALITYERREHDKAPTKVVREMLKIKDGKIVESKVLPSQ